MIFPIHLRDGSWIWGYNRYTGYTEWAGSELWNPYDLPKELSQANLDQLVNTHGYAIVATHLEGNADKQPLSGPAIKSLINLAKMQQEGKILVARTSRLLWYNVVQQGVQYHTFASQGVTYIDVAKVNDQVDGNFVPTWQQLRGITWSVWNPQKTLVIINGKLVPKQDISRSAHTIGVEWYPADLNNYAVAINSKEYQELKAKMDTKLA